MFGSRNACDQNPPICDRVYAVGGSGISSGDDCCVYLVDAKTELVLIDSGAGRGTDNILRHVKCAGYEPHMISYVIATHCHIDHIGGLHSLVQLYGPKVIAHQLDRLGIEEVRDDLTAARMYGVDYQPTRVDIAVSGEEDVLKLGDLEFHMLHTPGHTPGSISPYIDIGDQRVLFGQDVHGPFSSAWGSDIREWRRSIEKLIGLDADVLCEGHAGVFRGERGRKYMEACLKRYKSD